MTMKEFSSIFELANGELDFSSIVSAIPQQWKRQIKNNYVEWEDKEEGNTFTELMAYSKWSNIVYRRLISTEEGLFELMYKITEKFGISVEIVELKKALKNINKTTGITKYRSFQYKFLQCVIILNDRLVHMGLSKDNKCYNCNKSKENMRHFFLECEHVTKIKAETAEYLYQKYEIYGNWVNDQKQAVLKHRQ